MRRSLVLCVLLAVLGASCSAGDDDDPLADERGGGRGRATCDIGAKVGTDLLDCVGPALAYVETATATGSGVLLDDGYVVTNAHVVDPYRAVDLTFPDGTFLADVPVVGIDAFADIAVLGPIDDPGSIDADPLSLTSGQDLDKGSDVYLIGYPGEGDAEPEPTISRGVLSRIRQAADFDQVYLQTDASIGGGQSGGALVDDDGHLVGISGLSFAEEFALALDGVDVQESYDRIVAGDGDPYGSVPDPADAAADHGFDFADELDGGVLVIEASDDERTLEISAAGAPDVGILVFDMYFDPLLVNRAAVDLALAQDEIDDADEFGIDVSEPDASGVYEVELTPEVEAVVYIGTTLSQPVHVDVHTSIPSTVAAAPRRQPISLGDEVEGSFDFFEVADIYTLDLRAGDEVEVVARSPQGDMAVQIRAPGSPLEDVTIIDDGGGGLYDLDARDTFTAEVDGTYAFGVSSYDGVVTGYRFEVSAAN